jgi:hypothetical protein
METRVCRLCGGDPKPLTEFYENRVTRGDKVYVTHRTECRGCTDERTREYHQKNRDRVILNNCRKADKLLGLKTTITREEIRELISKPCEYCETPEEKMGVDRKDNSRGHMPDNTVPCCLRCNALKRDMPWEAWIFLVPKIREAMQLGLFGDWIGHNRGSNEIGKRKAASPAFRDMRLRENRDGRS